VRKARPVVAHNGGNAVNGRRRWTATLTVTFESFDVVVVPFPFTDRNTSKRRPACALGWQRL
jgi:hypothetical protein